MAPMEAVFPEGQFDQISIHSSNYFKPYSEASAKSLSRFLDKKQLRLSDKGIFGNSLGRSFYRVSTSKPRPPLYRNDNSDGRVGQINSAIPSLNILSFYAISFKNFIDNWEKLKDLSSAESSRHHVVQKKYFEWVYKNRGLDGLKDIYLRMQYISDNDFHKLTEENALIKLKL
ncbi:hypothetical protein [Carnimonas bestiolae]|uniref:hypothetical protein n=1 Tax=Carnimonas bestiolae TaxID=3402172 RepID=UPI003F4A9AAC